MRRIRSRVFRLWMGTGDVVVVVVVEGDVELEGGGAEVVEAEVGEVQPK